MDMATEKSEHLSIRSENPHRWVVEYTPSLAGAPAGRHKLLITRSVNLALFFLGAGLLGLLTLLFFPDLLGSGLRSSVAVGLAVLIGLVDLLYYFFVVIPGQASRLEVDEEFYFLTHRATPKKAPVTGALRDLIVQTTAPKKGAMTGLVTLKRNGESAPLGYFTEEEQRRLKDFFEQRGAQVSVEGRR